MSFTVVFDGDVKDLEFNPLRYQTDYGDPAAIAEGDKIEECDRLRAALRDAADQFDAIAIHHAIERAEDAARSVRATINLRSLTSL